MSLAAQYDAYFEAFIARTLGARLNKSFFAAAPFSIAGRDRLDRSHAALKLTSAEKADAQQLYRINLGKHFDALAPLVSPNTMHAFAANRFDIAPPHAYTPDDGDFYFIKINHGFWEQLYWIFGAQDETRMRQDPRGPYTSHYDDSGFIDVFRLLMSSAVRDDGGTLTVADVNMAVSLRGGAATYADVLLAFPQTGDPRVVMGAAIGLAGFFDELAGGERLLRFEDGAFPKFGLDSGLLEPTLRAFAAQARTLIFVTPPHLDGVRLVNSTIPHEHALISATHVHQAWAATLYDIVGHILNRTNAVGDVMVITQSAVFSALLGLFLQQAKAELLPDRRIFFFDLGQVLDIANPEAGGPWLGTHGAANRSLFHIDPARG